MINKIFLWVMLMLIMTFTLTGCWGSKDLTEFSILTAIGMDKEEDGKITLSIQIIKPSAAKGSGGGGGGGGGEKKSFVVMSNTEETVFGTIRGMLKKLDKKIYHSPAPVIIIGESAAKAGIGDIVDFVLRDHETQYKALIVMAKGTTAKEILEQEYELSKVPGSYIEGTIDNYDSNAFTEKKMLLEVAKDLVAEGKELTLPIISKVKDTTETEGVAVFLKDELVGFLDRYETRGYLFGIGKVKSTIVEVENPTDKKRKIGIEVNKASAKEKIEWNKDGSPKFKIDIKISGNIADQGSGTDFDEEELMKMLAKSCNEAIKDEVLASIAKCQKEYKCDVFGFGVKVFAKKPDYWKKEKDNWREDIYPNMEVEVEVDTKLLRTGLIGKSLNIK